MRKIVSAAIILSVHINIFAQVPTEIIVTPSRLEESAASKPISTEVLKAEDLKKVGVQSVADALKLSSSLDVVRSGGPGGNVAVFMRGMNSEHTLVLIDGMEVNDPSNTSRSFNFGDISLDNIERIEIVKGPQSLLYGSDALAGVINIITKSGTSGLKTGGEFYFGSFNTIAESANLNGADNNIGYTLSVSRLDTNGISAAESRDGNTEKDPYGRTSVSSKIDIKDLNLTNSFHYIKSGSQIDNAGGIAGDDLNRKVSRDFFTDRATSTLPLSQDIKPILGVGYTHHKLTDNNPVDEIHSDSLESFYKGTILKGDVVVPYKITESALLTAGVDSETEWAENNYSSQSSFGNISDTFSQKDASMTGVFGQAKVSPVKDLTLTGGARNDNHSKFGDQNTWRTGAEYAFSDLGLKVSSNLGTSFKAPSLFYLYSSYGNQDLNPEESKGWDFGFEKTIKNYGTVSLTYFNNDVKNLIQFDPTTFVPSNIGDARMNGLEFATTAELTSAVNLTGKYTYTDTQDLDTGASLLRRAKNKGSLQVNYQANDKLSLYTEVIVRDNSFDNDFATFPATRNNLAGYGIVNLGAVYKLCDKVEVFSRIENLLDKQYQDVLGFGTPGVGIYTGLRVRL